MSIVVVGSANTDMVVNVKHIPQEGETILGHGFTTHMGGKGANQAVAAAKLGSNVTYIANIGHDDFGDKAINHYQTIGINTDHIYRDGKRSGIALIMVSQDSGKNCIAVSPESNALLTSAQIKKKAKIITQAKVVLAQLETPIESIEEIANITEKSNNIFILNPAPGQKISNSLLKKIDIITPNETEAEILTDIKIIDEITAKKAAIFLENKGVKTVIITLGNQGVYVHQKHLSQHIPAKKVKAIDTTAAGDTFNGALATALVEDMPLVEAIQFATTAAAISVTKNGAQDSAPTREEVQNFI